MKKVDPPMQFILFLLSLLNSSLNPTTNSESSELINLLDRSKSELKTTVNSQTSLENNDEGDNAEHISTTEVDIETVIKKISETEKISIVFEVLRNLYAKEGEILCDTSEMSYEDKKYLIDKFVETLFHHKNIVIDKYHFLPELNLDDVINVYSDETSRERIKCEQKHIINSYIIAYSQLIAKTREIIHFYTKSICNICDDVRIKNELKFELKNKLSAWINLEDIYNKILCELKLHQNVLKVKTYGRSKDEGRSIVQFLSENEKVYEKLYDQIALLNEIFTEKLIGLSKEVFKFSMCSTEAK